LQNAQNLELFWLVALLYVCYVLKLLKCSLSAWNSFTYDKLHYSTWRYCIQRRTESW